MSDDDDDFTTEELETLASGIEALGTIDAFATMLQQTVLEYAEEPSIARGYYGKLLNDAADFVLAWQEFRATPFGALFDPRVAHDEDPPNGGREE